MYVLDIYYLENEKNNRIFYKLYKEVRKQGAQRA